MCGIGYAQCNGDHSVFYRHSRGTSQFLYMWMILLIRVMIHLRCQLKQKVSKEFEVKNLLKEICPRGNNNIVIIIFLVHDNVYIPC
jgi:hypothetical protein